MNYRIPVAASVVLAIAFTSIPSASFVDAQSPGRERPQLKDFGSSLKRLKWDSTTNATVEADGRENKAKPAAKEDIVRVETSLVVSNVLVLDSRGRPVPGLTQNDFVVTEDGKQQQVGAFSLGDNATVPRSIVLIMDHSCAQLPFLEASVEAAKTLVDRLGSLDRIAIVTDDVELLVGFTSDKKKLKGKLDELVRRTGFSHGRGFLADSPITRVPFGRGFQYSALMAVLNEAFDDEDERPIVIFQTDGEEAAILRNPIVTPAGSPDLPPDMKAAAQNRLKHFQKYLTRNGREFSLNDVYRAAEKSRATIYTVVPGFRLLGRSPGEQETGIRAYHQREISYLTSPSLRKQEADYLQKAPVEALKLEAEQQLKLQSALAMLSTITGGWIDFFDEPSKAAEIYSHIFSDLNRRYIVGYYPSNKEHDGKRRKLSIEVRGHPEYAVMSRKSYYASPPD